MLKNYVTLDSNSPWQIHYRTKGHGKAVVLLHPSPLSSSFMHPIIELLASEFRVIAWDTPGYGQSDPLPHNNSDSASNNLAPYVEALKQFFDSLALEDVILYGSATGAQIAIEFAKAYPNTLKGLVLENAALFTDEERSAWLDDYFPNIEPKEDGSHLTQVWEMVSHLFQQFPWFDESTEARVNNAQTPVAIRHQTLMEYFIAGKDYALAYKAAFLNERSEQLIPVKVPTHIIRWESSLIKKYVDRFDDVDLPANIQMRHAELGMENRFKTLAESVKELSASKEN